MSAPEKITAWLLEHGPATPKRLARELDLNYSTVRVTCRRLNEDEGSPVVEVDGAYAVNRHPETDEPLRVLMLTEREAAVIEAMRK